MTRRPSNVVCARTSSATDGTDRAPLVFAPVVGLGIVERIGQTRVAMVIEMAAAIDFVRQPQSERPAAESDVEGANARGMAVDRLVLEVEVPGDDPGAERG